MLPKEKMARINTLSRKSKTSGLSPEEKQEQQSLRQEYLKAFRGSMKNTLKGVTVLDPNGNDVTPEKLKEERRRDLH
ncbi:MULTISPECIES: DUF896 domain-containing protein [Metabacillus]|jgi:uncharacterized protein YnzC (UPF0291/DUF896 family)|uniref:UPF0291 protein GS18_0205330 n=1 Tax=Metabacillus indicus TaxID=246786 RepID=A0A084H436_METID|nr:MULTISPECIES: DUF896 domain-containing protein [Metabacillus]KEZ50189.1 hypothetical protein AZ46_0205645 [Metabacillus indicus LMG 22858]KEZ54348.1 hypothetical protein GS18_0205330 [Metabacillus indicus]MDX8288466.1 DUF896 domain-containing protein [Metabacillus indicus]